MFVTQNEHLGRRVLLATPNGCRVTEVGANVKILHWQEAGSEKIYLLKLSKLKIIQNTSYLGLTVNKRLKTNMDKKTGHCRPKRIQ